MSKRPLPVHGTQAGSGPAGARPSSYSLRVSLLEQCQLKCSYCLPGAVTPYTEKARWLRAGDYGRLGPLFAEVGVSKVRFTGGEPLLREDTPAIVAAFAESMPGVDLALTTNGVGLLAQLDALAEAGLRRLTVHLDTLLDERYGPLMGARGTPGEILGHVEQAKARFAEVKLNVVVQKGKNDDELLPFLRLSRELGVEVRFIELMNTGSAQGYVSEVFFEGRAIIERIAAEVPVRRRDRRQPSDPASLFEAELDGQPVTFGLIASDTEPFCDACDRLRLTADGRLRGCLYEAGGVPVGAALKAGADEEQLRALIGVGLEDKRSYHPTVAPVRVPFSMADIGG